MCRTEYHAGAVAVASMLYAKRSRNEAELKQNGILFGSSFLPSLTSSLFRLLSLSPAVLSLTLAAQSDSRKMISN